MIIKSHIPCTLVVTTGQSKTGTVDCRSRSIVCYQCKDFCLKPGLRNSKRCSHVAAHSTSVDKTRRSGKSSPVAAEDKVLSREDLKQKYAGLTRLKLSSHVEALQSPKADLNVRAKDNIEPGVVKAAPLPPVSNDAKVRMKLQEFTLAHGKRAWGQTPVEAQKTSQEGGPTMHTAAERSLEPKRRSQVKGAQTSRPAGSPAQIDHSAQEFSRPISVSNTWMSAAEPQQLSVRNARSLPPTDAYEIVYGAMDLDEEDKTHTSTSTNMRSEVGINLSRQHVSASSKTSTVNPPRGDSHASIKGHAAGAEEDNMLQSLAATTPLERLTSDTSFVGKLLAKAQSSKSTLLSSVAEALFSSVPSLGLKFGGPWSSSVSVSGVHNTTEAPLTSTEQGSSASAQVPSRALTDRGHGGEEGFSPTQAGPSTHSPSSHDYPTTSSRLMPRKEIGKPGSGLLRRRSDACRAPEQQDNAASGPRLGALSLNKTSKRSMMPSASSVTEGPSVTELRHTLPLAPAPLPPSMQKQRHDLLHARTQSAHSMLVLDSKRVPSMSFPRWRKVPLAAAKSLMRIQSQQYKVGQRQGYSRRLDRLVMAGGKGSQDVEGPLGFTHENPKPFQDGEGVLRGDHADPADVIAAEGEATHAEKDWQSLRGQYNAEVEIVNEVVEKFLGMRLPEKAFYGKRADQLAGMNLPELKAQCGVWLDICGVEYTKKFLEKEPTLLVKHPSWLLKALEVFNKELELDPAECLQFALKNTALLSVTPERLNDVMSELGELLGMQPEECRRMIMKNTTLLTMEEPLKEKVEALNVLLPVSQSKLSQILRQRPSLLTHNMVKLAMTIAELSNVTQLPLFNIAMLVAGQPALVGINRERIQSRWFRLNELVKQHPPWHDQLQGYSPPSLARCLAASDVVVERLAEVLELGRQNDTAAAKLKRILSMSEDRFRAAFTEKGKVRKSRISKHKDPDFAERIVLEAVPSHPKDYGQVPSCADDDGEMHPIKLAYERENIDGGDQLQRKRLISAV
ncbi:hypothetical protein CEUSTIGMA_g7425.t1 [Chlamydomonas eustigma]|uniref:Uncharacterized protein n=1 Tax=Chlamydomonas eustigma TaxID=1157962 RepID=A0A250XAC0_9CHLO|nr:hypothetical protein CEUSTIGMA_g7425.t1 [Chlamydomonas eustigma]|eukprot:GAX79986.1 hypothetical protein CEUSTIGMA_g7425.t1 [Chlamydomonas eustigma]